MTSPTETREAVARTNQTLRAQVRDCIGETPRRRRWVNAIMVRVVAPLHAEIESLRADAERSEKYLNDLMDTIVSLQTERGALREQLAAAEKGHATIAAAIPPTVERLRSERDALRARLAVAETALSEVSRLTAALAESERQGAVMREALEPFAREAERYDPVEGDEGDNLYGDVSLRIGHLRTARRALTLKEPTT